MKNTDDILDIVLRLSKSNVWLLSHVSAVLAFSFVSFFAADGWLRYFAGGMAGVLWFLFLLIAFAARIKHEQDEDDGNNLDA